MFTKCFSAFVIALKIAMLKLYPAFAKKTFLREYICIMYYVGNIAKINDKKNG